MFYKNTTVCIIAHVRPLPIHKFTKTERTNYQKWKVQDVLSCETLKSYT